MSWVGDLFSGCTLYTAFTTVDTTGAPTSLSSGALTVYKDAGLATGTNGITLSVDCNSVTGFNGVAINTNSSPTFYSCGHDYQVIVSAGTVGGTSIVGYVVAEFSLRNRSALRPTISGRELDVSTGGEAGLDWANIGSPTTSQSLSGTSTKALEPTVASRTLDVTATGEAGIDWANIGAPTTTVNLSGTSTKAIEPTVAGRPIDVSSGGAVGVDWANVECQGTTVTLTATTVATVTTATALTTNNDKTGYALTASERNSIADALLDRDMSTGTDSGSTTVRTVRQALRFLRNKWAIVTGTLTVYKEDDSTSSWTSSITTTSGADPVTTSDPAGP